VPEITEFPASFYQRRMWVLDQLEQNRSLYTVPIVLRLHGALDVAALKSGLDKVVSRHEVLRTTYRLDRDELVQCVHDQGTAQFRRQRLSPDTDDATLRALIRDEIDARFDLAHGPVVRATLLELSETEAILALAVHHIATDAQSCRIILNELASCYTALTCGSPWEPPPLPLQYGDFAEWQCGQLAGDQLAGLASHWRATLDGAPLVHSLPLDHERPGELSFAGGHLAAAGPSDLSGSIRALAAAESTTVFVVLLAAFAALLQRLSGSDDLIIGIPVSGRSRAELDPVVGFFVNMLPLRIRPDDAASFRQLVRDVHDVTLVAFDHQGLPFDLLVEQLAPARERAYQPLVQVVFDPTAAGDQTMRLGDVDATAETPVRDNAKFELMLAARLQGETVSASVEYASDLFERETSGDFLRSYHHLLHAAATNPALTVGRLPVLSQDEHQRPGDAGDSTRQRYAGNGARISVAREDAPAGPWSQAEHRLAGLWAQVLKLDSVDPDDSFFDLGGHSLLAFSLAAAIRRTLHVSLAVGDIFDAPTPRLMARWLAEDRPAPGAVAAIPTVAHDAEHTAEPFPFTDMQHAYWIGRMGNSKLGGFSAQAYVEFDVSGLDIPRLEHAWNTLVRRHVMLRAVISTDGRQRILPSVTTYVIGTTDLEKAGSQSAEQVLADIRHEMAHHVFAADQWPLFELRASHLGETTRLHLTFDAIIADGTSWRVLREEWQRLYEVPGLELVPLEFTFRDYVLAENALRSAERYEADRRYWLEKVPSLPGGPELPLAATSSTSGEVPHFRHTDVVGETTWAAIKSGCADSGLSPTMLALTCFGDVLRAWSKTSEFSVAATLGTRLPFHPDVPRMVGPFTSMVLAVPGSRGTLRERAGQVQRDLLESIDHGLFSGVAVAREMISQRGGGGQLVTPVVFTSALGHTGSKSEPTAPQFPGPIVNSGTRTPQVWLDLQVIERAGCLHVHWDAVEQLFPSGLVADLARAYRQRLADLGARPALWDEVAPIPLPAAQAELLSTFNDSGAAQTGVTLADLFVGAVAAHPEAVAVIGDNGQLTYRELAAASDAVARAVRAANVDRARPVAIVLSKGAEQVVAATGVALSGSPYLPVADGLPRDRRFQLMTHAGVAVAVTSRRLAGELKWPPGIRLIELDDLGPGDPSLPDVSAQPDDLAYVIYTSGSTGQPKGVAVEHRAAANTLTDVVSRFRIGPGDRALAVSSLDFDLSVFDIFGMFAAGGAVVVLDEGDAQSPSGWARLMREHRVTVWNSVPALFELLVSHLRTQPGSAPPALRLAMLSGDWVPLALASQARELFPELNAISLGGATEAAVWSVYYPIGEVSPDWPSVPYGRPLRGQTLRVLHGDGQPCPVWVPGDLYIGGAGLAREYFRDPDRTARAFPVHEQTGSRLYRTGDIARMLPDGNLEFLGREDTQVKLHGNRIELGEIESVLAQHPAVDMAIVRVCGDTPARRRLIAYAVCREAASPEDLRSYLATKLPRPMVPAQVLLLDRLPLSANGKVDRRALADPELADEAIAPASSLETKIAAIWAELLDVSAIGVTTNFFDAGGNSRLLVELRVRLSDELGREVPLIDLFEHPTVRDLAMALGDPQDAGNSDTASAQLAGILTRLRRSRELQPQRRA
jgi:amino acid adenylation domain-containing protein